MSTDNLLIITQEKLTSLFVTNNVVTGEDYIKKYGEDGKSYYGFQIKEFITIEKDQTLKDFINIVILGRSINILISGIVKNCTFILNNSSSIINGSQYKSIINNCIITLNNTSKIINNRFSEISNSYIFMHDESLFQNFFPNVNYGILSNNQLFAFDQCQIINSNDQYTGIFDSEISTFSDNCVIDESIDSSKITSGSPLIILFTKHIEKLNNGLEILNSKIENLNSEIEILNNEIKNLTIYNEKLSDENSTLSSTIEQLNFELEELKNNITNNITNQDDNLSKLLFLMYLNKKNNGMLNKLFKQCYKL